MTIPDGAARPVPVHVMSAAADVFPGSQDARQHIQAVFRTFVLTANNPVIVLAQDRSRTMAMFIAVGNTVVLGDKSQVQDAANQAAAAGAPAMLANTPGNPNGMVLFVPVVTGGGGTSERWPVKSTEVLYAVSMAPAILAVSMENTVTGY